MIGRAGSSCISRSALLASIELGAAREGTTALVVTSRRRCRLLLALALYFIAHQGHGKRRIAIARGPVRRRARPPADGAAALASHSCRAMAGDGAVIVACAFVGSFIFGVYLTLLDAARPRAPAGVHRARPSRATSTSSVSACIPTERSRRWTIGKDDMLADRPPLLIDRFEWSPARRRPVDVIRRRATTRARAGDLRRAERVEWVARVERVERVEPG